MPDAADVTFVMSTYNRAHLLPRALMSLINQSQPAKEIIVLDDASTDGTWELLREFEDSYPQLCVVRRECNSGGLHGAVLNEAVSLVRTTWYMPHSDDDSKRFECLRTLVAASDGADVVYGDSELHGTTAPQRSVDWQPELLRQTNYIDLGEGLVRKAVWSEVGGYQEDLIGAIDWEFWLRVATASTPYVVRHVPATITDYYFHEAMMTKRPGHQDALAAIRAKYGIGR